MKLPPSPPELVSAFEASLPGGPVVRRKMFGYPAAFVNGNLFASLFGEELVLRLSDRHRDELLVEGGSLFEPMPGRPMKGFVTAPPEIVADARGRSLWIRRALAYARRLPPKASARPPAPKKRAGALRRVSARQAAVETKRTPAPRSRGG